VSTKIYVEGGGNQKRTIQACRAAFAKYFQKVVAAGRQPRIVACGSRQSAYRDFLKGLDDRKYDRVLLLIDAEGPVASRDDAWSHLLKYDKWLKPAQAAADAAHLMIQCMESWFMADKHFLEIFYGEGFNQGALPPRAEIELIPKNDVSAGLENATRHTQKGLYHKARHGFDILAGIDPRKVEGASPACLRLHNSVRA
jgi:Domain of unknown function (DUF4276)